MTRAIVLSLSAASLVACASSTSVPDVDGATVATVRSPATVQRPVIAKLRTRDRIVSIEAADDGPRVSLATLDGEIVEQELTFDELRTKDPGIYAVISSSVATLDASIDRKFLARQRANGDL